MAEMPLLFFPRATVEEPARRGGGGSPLTKPTPEQQKQRLDSKFQRILGSFRTGNTSVEGMDPEQVVVLETIGADVENLAKAAAQVEGLEWLTEIELEDVPPSDGFADEKEPTKQLSHRLYALMSNQRAMAELVSLWNDWLKDPDQRAALNYGPFKNIFIHLKDVRRWGVEDRIQETRVVQYWEQRLVYTRQPVTFEVELWCRGDQAKRAAGYAQFQAIVNAAGGQVITRAVIPDILYFGVLAQLPPDKMRETVASIRSKSYTQLLRCEEVMFFRPHAQSIIRGHAAGDETLSVSKRVGKEPLPTGDPIVALLDGLPLERHAILDKRLVIDDEDGLSERYQSHQQQHGTSMASLIIHGDLSTPGPALQRPVYVRPVFVPYESDDKVVNEMIPSERLMTDVLHRAVVRIKGSGNIPGESPGVKVINLSIGDSWQPFFRHLSPCARLLDWLAWKYQLLFLVSVGNQSENIELACSTSDVGSLPDDVLIGHTLTALDQRKMSRRPFAPAEAINVLTVGALHSDGSTAPVDRRVDLLRGKRLPSPLATVASGFNRAVKPDILFPGGRQLYFQRGMTQVPPEFQLAHQTVAPGLCVAAPGVRPMELDRTVFTRGSSNATALATRTAAQIHERLETLRGEPGGDRLTDEYMAVILKTLLVHGASWGTAADVLENVFGATVTEWRDMLRLKCRFLGHGEVDPARCIFSTDKRVLMLGWDKLEDKQGHIYRVPLPPSMSGKKVKRRLTVTVGWFSPLNPKHKDYRRAMLWFSPPHVQFALDKTDLDQECSRRGTVQHQVFEGHKVRAFTDGDSLEVRVSCAKDAGDLPHKVPYSLAVTLEIADPVKMPIYQEMKDRIRLDIKVKPKVAAPQ